MPAQTCPRWTPAEDAQLLALSKTGVHRTAIGQALNRTPQACSARLHILRAKGAEVRRPPGTTRTGCLDPLLSAMTRAYHARLA